MWEDIEKKNSFNNFHNIGKNIIKSSFVLFISGAGVHKDIIL